MVLKFSFHFPFPISLPPPPTTPQHIHNHPTELQFSRWYNANADEHNERRQAQQDIEHDIRLQRRYKAATKITTVTNPTTPTNTNHTFKSIGTPSAPSRASIPGKHSKYSKPETRPHPAFRRIPNKAVTDEESGLGDSARVKLGEDGISYVIDGAPFEFKYSYTETPKVKPVKLREPGFAPFGPGTMPRPWTGRAPLPASKKKLKEFDSFEPPAPGTKGVKPVQAPGPFLPGSGPRYVRSREEVLGEALTGEEIKELVKSCIKSRRQLNIGRDGLTHNMLDNIHAHWKRRRVCKIKCKGVCTVDMDNVCQQLEERTGGKIIYRKDGVVYLFRGRNYNYRTRSRFPLMLWKPVTPVYPKLIKRVPEGLTLDEATEMRKKGKKLLPICKLAKNGVYCNLVKDVKEAFEECELVRIDCQGLNPSDYKKIGAKLKDLVPCVLLSFENEQILMWRGKEWKSSYPEPEADNEEVKSEIDSATLLEDKGASAPRTQMISHDAPSETLSTSFSSRLHGDLGTDGTVDPVTSVEINEPTARTGVIYPLIETCENNITLDKDSGILNDYFGSKAISHDASSTVNNAEDISHVNGVESILETASHGDGATIGGSMGSDDASNSEIIDTHTNMSIGKSMADDKLQSCSGTLLDQSDSASSIPQCTNGILHLLKQAVEDGSAVILDCESLDADIVYEKAVDLSLNAPPGPVFRHRPKKVQVERSEREITDSKEEEVKVVSEKKAIQNKNRKTNRTRDHDERLLDVEPQGSLRVDELAKLLA